MLVLSCCGQLRFVTPHPHLDRAFTVQALRTHVTHHDGEKAEPPANGTLRQTTFAAQRPRVFVEETVMGDFLNHLAHAALWVIGVMFIFSLIGIFATIRWIAGLVTGAGRAVESGVERTGEMFNRK